MRPQNELELPAAPVSPVSEDGHIQFGRYGGRTGRIDWSRAGRSQLWRFLHWKRWQYASVIGGDCVAAVAIADVGWAINAFAYLFDRRARRVLADISLIGIPRISGRVADEAGLGAASNFHHGGAHLSINHEASGWRISVRSRSLTIEAVLEEGPTTATVCAIARVAGGVANCTHKSHGLRARGFARVGEEVLQFDGSVGALDHTSGLLARNTAWRWASAASLDTAINLVDGFHEPLESTLWRDGRTAAIGPVDFRRESADPMAHWRIQAGDGSLDLVFMPEGFRSQDINLGFAVSRWMQPIGIYSGTVLGTEIRQLPGVLEDHVARW